MDTIRYLLGIIFRLVLSLFVIAFVLWLLGLFYPNFKMSSILSTKVFTFDWLPAPKNYTLKTAEQNPDGSYGPLYEPGPAYQHPGTQYVTFAPVPGSAPGTQMYTGTGNGRVTPSDERALYVRNLSVYEGITIRHGTTIIGEARDSMFKNGIFPVIIAETSGRVLLVTQAMNIGTWAAPGWARFQATISSQLPATTDCMMIFMSAQESRQIRLKVKCN